MDKRYTPPTLILYSVLFYFCSCAPARFVKPLAAKQQAINLSLGGPLIDYSDLPVPAPFLTATYGYGIDSSLTAFGSLNITSAVFGNAQVELGVNKRIFKQNGSVPGVSINPVANILYRNKDAAKFFPEIDVNAYWDYNKGRNLFYAGVSDWFELASHKAYGQKQPYHWLVSPMIGEYFNRQRWNFNVELKLAAANLESNKTVAEYKSPFSHHGAVAVYVGVTRKF